MFNNNPQIKQRGDTLAQLNNPEAEHNSLIKVAKYTPEINTVYDNFKVKDIGSSTVPASYSYQEVNINKKVRKAINTMADTYI